MAQDLAASTTLADMPAEIVAGIIDCQSAVDRFVCALVSPMWRELVLARQRVQQKTQPLRQSRRTFLAEAAYGGRLDLVQWAVATGCPWDDHACVEAVRGGHCNVIEWLQGAGCPLSVNDCLVAAADGGCLALVKRFLERQHDDVKLARRSHRSRAAVLADKARENALGRAIYRAAYNQRYDILEILLNDDRAWPDDACTIDTASVALFACLNSSRHGVPDCASEHAAARGCIDSLEWLRQRGKLYTHTAYRAAALHVRQHVINWLPRSAVNMPYFVIGAARHGQLDILNSLPRKPAPESFECRRMAVEAAHNGHLDVIQWLGCTVRDTPSSLTLAAAYGGHTHVLVWAIAKGIRVNRLATSIAAVRGHQETFRFCKRECGIGMLSEFDEPIWHGDANRRDSAAPFRFGPRRHALDMALEHGGADIVVQLVGCMPKYPRLTRSASALIMRACDPHIVKHMFRCADWAWQEAASKCDIAMIKHLYAAWGLPLDHVAQRMFVEAAHSRYGWLPVFEWLAWKGLHCNSESMQNMIRSRRRPSWEAIVWAADHGCPWPWSEQEWTGCLPCGSRLVEWVQMSARDPKVFCAQ